jgi:hypothetical protein
MCLRYVQKAAVSGAFQKKNHVRRSIGSHMCPRLFWVCACKFLNKLVLKTASCRWDVGERFPLCRAQLRKISANKWSCSLLVLPGSTVTQCATVFEGNIHARTCPNILEVTQKSATENAMLIIGRAILKRGGGISK